MRTSLFANCSTFLFAKKRTLLFAVYNRFSYAFAGPGSGFSAREITDYFTQYSALVKPHDHYGMNPTRIQLFVESVYALPPKQQYYSLNDLTFIEYPSRYPYPPESQRQELREVLHNFINPNPIGLLYSRIRETAFREDWVTCLTRVLTNPPAAITAARTMLETLMQTIITERHETPNNSGDIGRLFRQTQDVLNFRRLERSEEHQILTGLVSVVNGVAAISNQAGDRHGLAGGTTISDPYIANLCINASGALGLALIELHLLGN